MADRYRHDRSSDLKRLRSSAACSVPNRQSVIHNFMSEKETCDKSIETFLDELDVRRADMVIRRADAKKYHLLGDIGSQKTAKGYVAVSDDMDPNYRLGRDFIKGLHTDM